ncbi:MAG: tetratricopeptide repeat protein [Tissierellia bacterium]|nr:tetratricopeptide repeat protein [Tissierellia bacterium]
MDIIEKTFKEKTKEISFIELKEDASLNIKGFTISGGTPLPVLTDNLIKELQYNDLSNEINLVQVIEGIIFLLGIDSGFPFINIYKDLLYKYDDKIEEYIFYKGMKALENKDLINGGIFFRANLALNTTNVNARLNYGLILEEFSKDYFEKNNDEYGLCFLNKSTSEFESILEIDDKYSLAYYKLGYHYSHNEQYLKAKLTWDKFIMLDKDENRLQEIREQIDLIEDKTNLEIGLTYLSHNDFEKALDSFLKLLPTNKKNWNVNYLIGLCYSGLEEYEYAIKFLNHAIDLNKEEADIYNELGIIYYLQDNLLDALEVFNNGIEYSPTDYKLYYNRGLTFIKLGEYLPAITDINTAYEMNPNDENVIQIKRQLENN